MPVLPEELLSGSEHWMPGWFLDMNIRLVWWGKHRRTTEKWCIHCNTHGKLIGSSTLCSKNYLLCCFPMLSNVVCYAIDSHPLFHNIIIIIYKNLLKFIKFILQSSQCKFTRPSIQLYNRLPVVLKHEWCLSIIHERMLLLIWEWVVQLKEKTLSVYKYPCTSIMTTQWRHYTFKVEMPGNEPGNAPLLKERLMTIRIGVYKQSKTCVTLHVHINSSYLLRINTVLLCTYKLQFYLLSS